MVHRIFPEAPFFPDLLAAGRLTMRWRTGVTACGRPVEEPLVVRLGNRARDQAACLPDGGDLRDAG